MPAPKAMSVLRVQVNGPERAVRKVLVAHPLEPQQVAFEGDVVSLLLFVSEEQLHELGRTGLRVRVLFDSRARDRRGQVGTGNRFEGGRIPPGVGVPVR